jgi:pimeloyl-ACP methyl ester carboxylesterase
MKRYQARSGHSYLMEGRGTPLLLLHGIPGSAYAWEAVGNSLKDRYRVIVPDLLGFGESPPPAGDFYMEAQAQALHQLILELEMEAFYLAGHDFGGPVALTLLRKFPALKVKALVLSQGNLFTDTPIPLPLQMAKVPLLGTPFFYLAVGNVPALYALYRAAAQNQKQATWGNFRRHLTPQGIRYTRQIFQRSLSDLPRHYGALEKMLPTLSLPTLILWAGSDPFFAEKEGFRLQQAIPGAALKIYAHCGHFLPEEYPEQTAKDLALFFRQLEAQATKS